MGKVLRRRPSPATAIAAAALFVALGSGAYAASQLPNDSVGGKTIKDGAVHSADIHNGAVHTNNLAAHALKTGKIAGGAVTSSRVSFIKSAVVSAANATSSNTPVDLGGPSVTVTVPSGGVVEVFAEAQISQTGGGTNAAGEISLTEPTLVATPQTILSSGSPSFQTRYTAPGSNDFSGAINITRGGWLTIAPPPGTYTFSLRYAAPGGGQSTFQNRALLVRVTK
jgi:hypothetical protein